MFRVFIVDPVLLLRSRPEPRTVARVRNRPVATSGASWLRSIGRVASPLSLLYRAVLKGDATLYPRLFSVAREADTVIRALLVVPVSR